MLKSFLIFLVNVATFFLYGYRIGKLKLNVCLMVSDLNGVLSIVPVTPANIRLDEDDIFVLVIRLQDVFKTFSRRLQDVLPRRLQKRLKDVFKKFSRHLQYSQVELFLLTQIQDILETYYQVKLSLVTQFQDVLETYLKRF